MAEELHLSQKHREKIAELLGEHLPDVEVWAYGSRVNGRSHDGSDLDLVLRGPKLAEIDASRLAELIEALRESTIPFLVEARDWARLPDSFHREIEREHVVLVDGDGGKLAGQWLGAASEWQEVLLRECTVVNDSTYSPREAWPIINYLDTGNILENRVSEIQQLEVGQHKIPSRARRKVQPGDIVYSTVRPNQKHFGLLKSVPDNFLASTGFAVLRGTDGLADTGFIYWFLVQDHIVDYLQSIAENSTSAYPSIRPSDLEQLTLSLPPLPEQRAIAHILGTLDDKIELNRRMNETLEAMARALFRSWFVDFEPVRAKMAGRDAGLPKEIADLFPDRLVDSELGEVPEGWNVSEIGAEVDAVGGGTPSTREPAYWNGGQHCWATPKDLSKLSSPVLLGTDRMITDAGVQKISSGLLPRGTVLLSSRAPIGYVAITEVPTAVNQGFIAMICQKRLPALYVLFWCHENLEHIKDIAGGSTFAEISKKVFRPLPIVIPPKRVLGVYDEASRSLHDRIVSNTGESALLVSLRDALLPKLVSGEMRVEHSDCQGD